MAGRGRHHSRGAHFHGKAYRDHELDKALKALQRGDNPEELLRQFARNLTNKFLHQPTSGLKQAGEEGRQDQIRLAEKLFGMGEANSDKT